MPIPLVVGPIYTFLICYGYIFVFRAALQVVISDLFHLRLGASVGGDQQHSYSFPTGPSVCWGGRGGGGGGKGQQASSLSSKHKLWNFHRSC